MTVEKSFSPFYSELLQQLKDARAIDPDNNHYTNDEFLVALLPFNWYLNKKHFPPIYSQIQIVHDILKEKDSELMEVLSLSGLTKLLHGILKKNCLDGSGWLFLGSSAELAAAIDLKKVKIALEKNDPPTSEIKVLEQLIRNFEEINSAKNDAYWSVRKIGASNIDKIDHLVDSLHPDDQHFILHGLDSFGGNQDVIQFLKNYIGRTKIDFLKEKAEKYLERIDY